MYWACGMRFKYVTSGKTLGVPTLVVMAIPFIVGLVAGFLIKRILKIGIILVILALVPSYFGLLNISLDSFKDTTNTYGPQIV